MESVFITTSVTWVAMFIMQAFTAAGVQSFYAWRIYILSQRRRILPTVILGVRDLIVNSSRVLHTYWCLVRLCCVVC